MSDYTVGCIRQLNECAEGEPIQEIPRSFMVDLRAELQAKDAKIERLRKMISVDTDLLCEKEAEIEKLQAVVDYVQTIDHLQANEYLQELIAALNTGEQEAVAVGTSGTGANAEDDGPLRDGPLRGSEDNSGDMEGGFIGDHLRE